MKIDLPVHIIIPGESSHETDTRVFRGSGACCGVVVWRDRAGGRDAADPDAAVTGPTADQRPDRVRRRPGSPFLYSIPATGDRPIEFSVEGLPAGLTVDAATGHIRGTLNDAGVYKVVLRAKNARGSAQKAFRIVIGEQICLTPPMGWNSWNCWAEAVDQDKVLRSARAMVNSGLIHHGWTYVNIDDTWQGRARRSAATPSRPTRSSPT